MTAVDACHGLVDDNYLSAFGMCVINATIPDRNVLQITFIN